MGRTCGEPDEIKKNTHPKNITALFREQAARLFGAALLEREVMRCFQLVANPPPPNHPGNYNTLVNVYPMAEEMMTCATNLTMRGMPMHDSTCATARRIGEKVLRLHTDHGAIHVENETSLKLNKLMIHKANVPERIKAMLRRLITPGNKGAHALQSCEQSDTNACCSIVVSLLAHFAGPHRAEAAFNAGHRGPRVMPRVDFVIRDLPSAQVNNITAQILEGAIHRRYVALTPQCGRRRTQSGGVSLNRCGGVVVVRTQKKRGKGACVLDSV